jgi:hypothetical protein
VADLSKIYFGSGGGQGGGTGGTGGLDAGTGGGAGTNGTSGGNGGGIVIINAGTVSITGSITSNGAAPGGNGGGGAGGSIQIFGGTALTLGTSLVAATGGGNGGSGRIAITYSGSAPTGTTNPSANVASVAPSGAYATSATIQSTNLLSGQYAGAVKSVTYNLSAKPAGTTATIQFSQNSTDWYNSSHSINQSNTLTTGSNNNIDLSAESWSGPNFYYKVVFGSDGTATPVLDDIAVNYVGGLVAIVPNSSNTAVSTDSYFVGVTDATDSQRVIDGVDTGTGDTNTSVVTISNGASLTVNSNETLVAGSFVITDGSIVLATSSGQRAVLKPGGRIYSEDKDGDTFVAHANTVFVYDKGATIPSQRTRRKSLASLSTVDCNDNAASATNTCTGNVGAACTADVQCTIPICGTDADGDLLFSAALGHTGTCQATAYPYTDTNDGQYCPTGYQPAGTCNKCVNGAIAIQTSSEDLWNQCTAGNCATGNCNGTTAACQSSGNWTCSQCNASCCSIAPNSHCTSTTCGNHSCGSNCASNGGANYCSGFDVNGSGCVCHYEPTNNCNPQPCNCSCQ